MMAVLIPSHLYSDGKEVEPDTPDNMGASQPLVMARELVI